MGFDVKFDGTRRNVTCFNGCGHLALNPEEDAHSGVEAIKIRVPDHNDLKTVAAYVGNTCIHSSTKKGRGMEDIFLILKIYDLKKMGFIGALLLDEINLGNWLKI